MWRRGNIDGGVNMDFPTVFCRQMTTERARADRMEMILKGILELEKQHLLGGRDVL